MRAENKSLKDGKSMGKWKLNYFTQFFCSVIDVSFTNCKSIHQEMITIMFFSQKSHKICNIFQIVSGKTEPQRD